MRREARYPERARHLQDVLVADAEGRVRRNLTRRVGRGSFSGAAWSPDGRQFAFVSVALATGRLMVMNADGSGGRELASADGTPSWSPDGRRPLFSRYSSGGHATYVIDRDGANERRLLDSAWGAVWSPDGSRLAYIVLEGGRASLAVARADGSEPRLLTGDVVQGRPAWSPDGGMIAFMREAGRSIRIVLIRPDGTGERTVATGSLPALDPAWRPAAPLPPHRRPCVVRGTAGRDVLHGTDRGELIQAGSGADTIYGAGGGDVLIGGGGHDRLLGGRGDDFFAAKDREKDVVSGGPGTDGGYFDRRLDRLTSIERRR